MTDSALLIRFETYIEGMKKLDFAALTRSVLDCIRLYDEETKVIREVQRIMSDEEDSDWVSENCMLRIPDQYKDTYQKYSSTPQISHTFTPYNNLCSNAIILTKKNRHNPGFEKLTVKSFAYNFHSSEFQAKILFLHHIPLNMILWILLQI